MLKRGKVDEKPGDGIMGIKNNRQTPLIIRKSSSYVSDKKEPNKS